MFKDMIQKPQLVKQFKTFTTGNVEKYQSDESLFVVMVLLLYKRAKNLALNSHIFYSGREIPAINPAIHKDAYTFNWIECGVNNNFDNIDKYVPHSTKLENVEDFVFKETGKKVKVRTYPQNNTVNIYTDFLNASLYHFMISFFSLYFPVFKEQPLTKKEIEFMRTLSLKTCGNFNKLLDETLADEDFKRFLLKHQMHGFEKNLYGVKMHNLQEKLNSFEVKMEELLREYSEAYEAQQDVVFMLEGLKARQDEVEENGELEEYIINNKSLTNVMVEGSRISFIVKTYLIPYLTSTWKDLDRRGTIYRDYPAMEKEDIKLLLNAIFSEKHCLKLRMCAYFALDYIHNKATSIIGYNYVRENIDLVNYIPNTHLNKHNCFGQNMPDILSNIKAGDTIGAIECCINCAKRINVNESSTFATMVNNLVECKGKCLVAEDGTEMTPKEAVQYLKELCTE